MRNKRQLARLTFALGKTAWASQMIPAICAQVIAKRVGENMPMVVDNVSSFKAERAWGARDIAEVEGASIRLHWTNEPYRWHINDGPEVFVVLDGSVRMHYRVDGKEYDVLLRAGGMFVADVGDEHVARPEGEARILVIEKKGSL
jgi:mannose-6-phosphate isomerase-like protein (cupin superfamily)